MKTMKVAKQSNRSEWWFGDQASQTLLEWLVKMTHETSSSVPILLLLLLIEYLLLLIEYLYRI
jgi:hypothetical protein